MLMIGTNNTRRAAIRRRKSPWAWRTWCFELRKDFPDAKILLLGIFPAQWPTERSAAKIDRDQQHHFGAERQQHVFYMDIGSKFLAEDGSIPKDIMSDGLHPTSKGYEIWAEAVKEPLENFLK